MAAHGDVILQEIQLDRLRSDIALWQSFLDVQQPWLDAGVTRWLALLRVDGAWPAFVLAAWHPDAPSALLGTIVGIWAEAPVARFDDLLEQRCPQGWRGADRPHGGVWHFIAATAHPRAEGLNLGRRLVGAALDWLPSHAPGAIARTLSPAVGLPTLRHLLPDGAALRDIVLHLANAKGQPALDILRLHMGAGATLEAILPQSRRDEVRSGRVTLRFAYALDPQAREVQKARYQAWLTRRAAQIAANAATQTEDPTIWCVRADDDAAVTTA